ncbi:DUF4429 domain-containing protein [Cellulosimicrobium cellulans]|uniref:DUF4429 domain-containing protein n=1 Tax=Cellulosimicrobium cellulans TaxID=1710 RepID=UPI002149CBE4|nr:DUF4429 domain-containing protein [Cellulosimicrobium cellulans]
MSEITAQGVNGTVVFDGQWVTITRGGFYGTMTVGKGQKRIPVSSITAVQWNAPNALVNGFIQFTVAGGTEVRSKHGRQTKDALRDENSVVVKKKQVPDFLALRDAVEAAIASASAPAPVSAAVSASGADEVARLAELHAAGHLSEEEFTAAKRRALGIQ